MELEEAPKVGEESAYENKVIEKIKKPRIHKHTKQQQEIEQKVFELGYAFMCGMLTVIIEEIAKQRKDKEDVT